MLLSLAFALAFIVPCPSPERTPHAQAARRSEPKQQKIDVEAALRARGVEVEFTGSEIFSRRELLDLLSCDESAATYFVEGSAAAKFSEDDGDFRKLDAGLYRLTNLLRSSGYLRAAVRGPRAETTAAGRKLFVTVNEGALYRLGKVEFNGSKMISPERLAEMFPLKAGDVANAESIYELLFEKLKRLYGDRGHIQYEADAEPSFTAEAGAREGTVDFLITLSEGKSFVLRSVEFEGNARTSDALLRPAVLLREGEPYSQAILDASLKRLEATGLFERIDRDRDVNYQVNEQQGQVMVRIKLKEKSTP